MNDTVKTIEETFNIKLPQDYIEYMENNNGYTGMMNGNYCDIWKLDDIISRNSGYKVQEFFPNLVCFGSNGGGEAFAFDKSNNMSIVSIPFIGTEADKIVVADNFSDFINKKDNTYTRYLQNVVTNLPKTEGEKKKQKRFDILMSILVLSPMIIGPALMAFNYYILGVSIMVLCWGMFAIIGINKRKRINKEFYKIENAHTKFNIVNVDDKNIIKELYKNSALTFVSEPSNELLDFIFNWLNNENVLKSNSLNLYVFNGHMLKQVFDYSRYDDDTKFLSIFLKDLDINDSNIESFSRARFSVGSRWLDDIVDNDKR